MKRNLLRSARCSLACAGGLLLFLAALGCGSGQGTVSGRVLYQKQPVPGGLVTFVPVDPKQQAISAVIDEDGRYELTVAAGEVRIAVDNETLRPQPVGAKVELPPGLKLPPIKKGQLPPPEKATQPKPSGKYRAIPEKYYRIDTSDLRYTVIGGSQTYDIVLK
jgi:hypothetical protein